MFEILEHTADIGFRARASTLPQLFESAAEALVAIAMETENIEARESYRLAAEGDSEEALLVNWLSEVLYYVEGNFMSRRGIEEGSISLHPSGLPHGPHPGAAEASIGKPGTEELAVMIDTFHPLRVAQTAVAIEDPQYAYSWAER